MIGFHFSIPLGYPEYGIGAEISMDRIEQHGEERMGVGVDPPGGAQCASARSCMCDARSPCYAVLSRRCGTGELEKLHISVLFCRFPGGSNPSIGLRNGSRSTNDMIACIS